MNNVWTYVYRDLVDTLGCLPYGLAIGLPLSALTLAVLGLRQRRLRKERTPASWGAVSAFCVYAAILMVITFFSREEGSTNGVDLKLFSSWGINARNDAYVIENVLLFIPYGFLCRWNFQWAKNFFFCAFYGMATSLCIGILQLLTGRGYFQADDILTNTLGTAAGFLLFELFGLRKRKQKK